MGLFSNLSQTKILGDANYTKYGNYVVRIDKVKRGETRLREQHIIIDYTVIAVLAHQEPPPNHVVGEEACHYIGVTGNEYAQADWASFVSGVFEVPVTELDSPQVKAACNNRDIDDWASNENPQMGPVQPMRGMVMELNNRMVMTKDKPNNPSKPFTKVRWKRPVPKEEVLKLLTPEQVNRFFPAGSLQ